MRGIVEIDIPDSCLDCPFCGHIDINGWQETLECKALKKTIDILDDSSEYPEDWTTLDYANDRYLGCPIKEIKRSKNENKNI